MQAVFQQQVATEIKTGWLLLNCIFRYVQLVTRNENVRIYTKDNLATHKVLWSVSVRVARVASPRGLTLGTEWGTASAPCLALPLLRLLDLRRPVPVPEHGAVLVLSSSSFLPPGPIHAS